MHLPPETVTKPGGTPERRRGRETGTSGGPLALVVGHVDASSPLGETGTGESDPGLPGSGELAAISQQWLIGAGSHAGWCRKAERGPSISYMEGSHLIFYVHSAIPQRAVLTSTRGRVTADGSANLAAS
jgi:hypothetical protein